MAYRTGDATFNNVIMSLPVPALTPSNYVVPDGFGFYEIGSLNYGAANDGGGGDSRCPFVYVNCK